VREVSLQPGGGSAGHEAAPEERMVKRQHTGGEDARDGREMRHVLFITRSFYPQATVDAVRVTEWCRHLPAFGWRPSVAFRGRSWEPNHSSIARGVHPAVNVHLLSPASRGTVSPSRHASDPALEPSPNPGGPGERGAARTIVRVKEWVERLQPFVPDPTILFWNKAWDRIKKLVDESNPDVIVTSSPPHSIHVLGMRLSVSYPEIPWIADFRDPYLIDRRYRPRALGVLRQRAHREFEARIYAAASMVVHAIPLHFRHARRRYPEYRDRMRLLTNGSPIALGVDYEHEEAMGSRPFRVVSVGKAGHEEAEALARALRRLLDLGWDLELRLLGPTPAEMNSVSQILGGHAVLLGQVPHQDALQEIREADLLASLCSLERSKGAGVSSRLYEYLAVARPTLVVNPTRSDAWLLKGTEGVAVFRSPSVEELATGVLDALEGRLQRTSTEAAIFREANARDSQVRKLARWMDELCERRSSLALRP